MNEWQRLVRRFMYTMNQDLHDRPRKLPLEVAATRSSWLLEEALEVQKAALSGDTAELAKELADVVYIALGTANSAGIDLSPVFEAVHESNMQKKGAYTGADGKVLKPEGWKPPNIISILREQGWEG